jgi:hypothetical protein
MQDIDISTRHTAALYWAPGHAGVLFKCLLALSRSWGVSRHNIKNNIKRWVGNHH